MRCAGRCPCTPTTSPTGSTATRTSSPRRPAAACGGVEIWAAIASLGRDGIEELVEHNCLQARRFAAGLRDAGWEILADVVLNQVLVAFGDDRATADVIEGVQRDGTCWCGGTSWHGRTAMRISVSSWATTGNDVERSLAAILRVAEDVRARAGAQG